MMQLIIWDVDHGLASYLRTPNGLHFVFDLGIGDLSGRDATFSPLQHLVQSGVKQLHEVVISHPHRDHLDDIHQFDALSPAVLRRPRHLTEQDIRAGNRPTDKGVIDKYLEIDRRYTQVVEAGTNPEMTSVNGGVEMAFFTPTQCARTNLNNHSIISFLTYANVTVCLPGDNEAPSWRELLADTAFCRLLKQTSVFIAPHHGREAGYCEDVFRLCTPLITVVSDGPIGDTSAIGKYQNHTYGWKVRRKSSGELVQRKVLTTRNDGEIEIRVSASPSGPSLDVAIP